MPRGILLTRVAPRSWHRLGRLMAAAQLRQALGDIQSNIAQAVAKLTTAIAGNTTPDVSQMGTDMMGQFVETGAIEPVPADIDPEGVALLAPVDVLEVEPFECGGDRTG